MRVIFFVLLLLFAIPLIVFLFLNDEQTVTVHLVGETSYTDVRLSMVVLLAVAAGAGLVGLIAVVEGAAIRLANHKLRRELRTLETEVNLLRTSPAGGRSIETDDTVTTPPVEIKREEKPRSIPTAPVYSPDDAYGDD